MAVSHVHRKSGFAYSDSEEDDTTTSANSTVHGTRSSFEQNCHTSDTSVESSIPTNNYAPSMQVTHQQLSSQEDIADCSVADSQETTKAAFDSHKCVQDAREHIKVDTVTMDHMQSEAVSSNCEEEDRGLGLTDANMQDVDQDLPVSPQNFIEQADIVAASNVDCEEDDRGLDLTDANMQKVDQDLPMSPLNSIEQADIVSPSNVEITLFPYTTLFRSRKSVV